MRREPLFKLLSAITVATGPWLCSVFVPARAAGMGVLNAEQLEILFPIRTFLRERWIAKARFNPGGDTLIIYPRLLHVVQVFVACDGTFSKRAIVDCANQITFPGRFHAGFHEVTHDTDVVVEAVVSTACVVLAAASTAIEPGRRVRSAENPLLRCDAIGQCVGMKIGVITQTVPGAILLGGLRDTVLLARGKVFPRIVASDG